MLADQRSISADQAGPAKWTSPATVQLRLMPPSRRSLVGNIFSEEIIACMIEARRPTVLEVQRVAARIWTEVQAGAPGIAWRDIVPGCGRYRRMIAAARAALGDRSEAGTGAARPAPQ